MTILYVANISNNPTNGVCVSVPIYVKLMSKYNDVGLLNLQKETIEGVTTNFFYDKSFDILNLPKPFNKPDLVIFNEVFYTEYIAISKQLRKQKIKYIIIGHGTFTSVSLRKKMFKKKIARLLMFDRFVNGAIAFQCLSDIEKKTTHVKCRRFISNNGVFLPTVYKTSFNIDKLEFVYIGRLDVYQKGIDIMLDSINAISGYAREKQCHFSIYGPFAFGREKTILKIIKKYGIDDLVSLNPSITGRQKEKLLLSSDVFIQTSRIEGLPLGVLEAMSYGVPVLITKGTCLGDSIIKTGSGWVSETNSDALSNTLVSAINSKDLLMKFSTNARKAVVDYFLWESTIERTNKVYKDLILK